MIKFRKKQSVIDMIYDYINLNRESKTPLYKQLYASIRKAIESNGLTKGDRLVSIRKLSKALNISKTTVEAAYSQLCAEGYIKNHPQRGYFIEGRVLKIEEKPGNIGADGRSLPTTPIRYDLGSKSVAVDSTGIRLWKKYVRFYLNKDYVIASYGDPQGEPQLRRALSFYSYSVRGVIATDENIVIAAGTQSVLYIICGLLRSFGIRIAVESEASPHIIRVFIDCGFTVIKTPSDSGGLRLDKLKESNPDFVLINPSGSLKSGDKMQMERRYELIRWAESEGKYIIEDDFNGEIVYRSRPIPALQCNSPSNVVYLGSFSKLLLPSVRIGYAVLPENLCLLYSHCRQTLNQTASKLEQLALADYIKDGHLERHLRRLKKIYAKKSEVLKESIIKNFKLIEPEAGIKLFETSLAYSVTINREIDSCDFLSKLQQSGIEIISCEAYEGQTSIRLGFSGIDIEKIEPAVELLCSIIDKL